MAKARGSARSKGRRKRARTGAASIARAEHIAIALELRRIGYTFREIAAAMSEPKTDGGYGIGRRVPIQTAFGWVRDAYRRFPRRWPRTCAQWSCNASMSCRWCFTRT